jgi:hypothetical protein
MDVEICEKVAKAAAIVRAVRGQQQHFRTKLEDGRAPRSCRAHEQMMNDVQPGKITGRRGRSREGHFRVASGSGLAPCTQRLRG